MISVVKFKSRLKIYVSGAIGVFFRVFLPWIPARNNGRTRVIVFHHIDSEKAFEKIIKSLVKQFNVISFRDFTLGRVLVDQVNVVVALDDGYKSWYENALPVFLKHSLEPLLFVNSGFVGGSSSESKDFCRSKIKTWEEPSMSWAELSSLLDAGCEVGGHTVNHIDLMDDGIDSVVVSEEISNDREGVFENTGVLPRAFAYPFGRFTTDSIDLVDKAGYEYAFTSISGFIDESPSNLEIRRTNVGMRSPWVVAGIVDGWLDNIERTYQKCKGCLNT